MENTAIVKKLLEHDDKFVKLETKMDRYHNETNGRFDEVMVILKRLDQERVFTTEWIKRIEHEVERNRSDIDRMKQELKVD